MIRIIDEEGYEIRVILNNLNLRIKYFGFIAQLLGDIVKVVDAPTWLIEAKNRRLLVSGSHTNSIDSVRELIELTNPNIDFILNFEKQSLDVIFHSDGGMGLDRWVTPSELYPCLEKGRTFDISSESFKNLMKKHSGAVMEKVVVDGKFSSYLIRVADFDREFINDLKTSSN